MDVYLVPAGGGRHVLYCEPAGPPAAPAAGRSGAIWRRLYDHFAAVLAMLDREHDPEHEAEHQPPSGFFARLRSRSLKWMAERVAEQRVLWRLQGIRQARAFHPDTLERARSLEIVRENLRADFRRHARLLGLDAFYLLVAIVLTPIPGPNLLGYYFSFRVVGHVLSVRGARQGLSRVEWDLEPSAELSELAALDGLPAAERAPAVHSVAERLGLPRLPRFCERLMTGVP